MLAEVSVTSWAPTTMHKPTRKNNNSRPQHLKAWMRGDQLPLWPEENRSQISRRSGAHRLALQAQAGQRQLLPQRHTVCAPAKCERKTRSADMSTKHLFLTHDTDYVGKKSNNLPMADGTCTRNGGFLYTSSCTCTRNRGFLCMTSAGGGNHE